VNFQGILLSADEMNELGVLMRKNLVLSEDAFPYFQKILII